MIAFDVFVVIPYRRYTKRLTLLPSNLSMRMTARSRMYIIALYVKVKHNIIFNLLSHKVINILQNEFIRKIFFSLNIKLIIN